MKKLRLELDQVTVESFPTTAIPGDGKGTVAGAATGNCVPTDGNGGGCTLDGCSGGGKCSWDFDCSVGQCSDVCTAYPGCSYDGNCSKLDRCTGLTVCFWTP
jgi:hypothetical protein